jgi:hypothetical protein
MFLILFYTMGLATVVGSHYKIRSRTVSNLVAEYLVG